MSGYSLPEGVNGYCDTRFRAVAEAFADNFNSRGDTGASAAVCLDGKMVVNVWGGYMDKAGQKPWQADTLVNVWSLGKAMSALALLRLLDEKGIDPESRVSDYWPAFAAEGKGDITFACLMSHQAGLPALAQTLPLDAHFQWDLMCDALAAQKPWWEPGTRHGYHTNTLGFLLGEPIRRITGMSINDWFQKRIGKPMDVSFYMGTPASELHRIAYITHMERPADMAMNFSLGDAKSHDPMERMRHAVYRNPPLEREGDLGNNSERWRTAVFPSTAPQSNAASVARIFGTLVLPDQTLISRELLARATAIAADGTDLVVGRPTRFGLGFQLTQPDRPLGPHAGTFGHYGNGGHLGFADPEARLGFAYHMRHHGFAWRDPRNIALTEALYSAF